MYSPISASPSSPWSGIAGGHGRGQGVLPARRGHPHRQCADHRHLADHRQADAGRHDPAADPQLQRLHRAGAADGVLQPDPG
ncbi:hypothetical protein G6F40_017075 [Rhizopus arrhizus]|nr:hypothetical protein G6F40_017075 [Rhizopus arrhizus]